MLAGRGGAQIIYSAAVDRQWAPHAGVISSDFLLPLGYEHLCVPLTSPAALPPVPGLRAVSGVSASVGSKPASRSGFLAWPAGSVGSAACALPGW